MRWVWLAVIMSLTAALGGLVGKFQFNDEPEKAPVKGFLQFCFALGWGIVLFYSFRTFGWMGLWVVPAQFAAVSLARRVILSRAHHAASDSAARKMITDKIEEARRANNPQLENALQRVLEWYDIFFG